MCKFFLCFLVLLFIYKKLTFNIFFSVDFWFPETFTAVVIANQQNKGKGVTKF